jgi:phthalate 4,5-dioxygenase oxygenase subunit
MLSQANNERVTRTGPGTPMGEAMRRYWIPALLSAELPGPDSAPVRVRLLGEDLVAFRATSGQAALIEAKCPHRGASLFFGRNEANGLRCVYHGWKFDTAGTCVDMPTPRSAALHGAGEPAESELRSNISARAYPCVELAGTVWTFMGPAHARPPLQTQEWMRVPPANRDVCKQYGDCNWLQLLEGGIDTSHSSFLHRSFDAQRAGGTRAYRARSTAPTLHVLETDYGFTYAGIRPLPEDGQSYVRVYQYVMPFHQMRAFEGFLGHALVSGHIWVPADDEHTWVWSWTHTANGEPLPAEVIDAERRQAGRRPDVDVIPGTYRFTRNRSNDYLVDRGRQKSVNYTGIETIAAQDQAIQESMGPISDRSLEHLGTSDLAIIAARRLLLQAGRDVEAGTHPLGSQLEHISARPAEMLLDDGQVWHEAMRAQLVAAI